MNRGAGWCRYEPLGWEFPSWAAINGPAFNILKGAVAVSDRIITVSKGCARLWALLGRGTHPAWGRSQHDQLVTDVLPAATYLPVSQHALLRSSSWQPGLLLAGPRLQAATCKQACWRLATAHMCISCVIPLLGLGPQGTSLLVG